jgi:hypothetical protein
VSIRFSSAAYDLPSGVYFTTLWFTNENTGLARARQFTLQVSQTLVQNSGFETGDFSHWTLSGSPLANSTSSGSPIAPHSGNYAAAFGQYGSLAYLSQTLPTSPGQPYLLSFWLENPVGGVPNQFLVNWNTNVGSTNNIFSQTNLMAFGWTNLQFVVTAVGTSSTLQFGFRKDLKYFGLDDVNVTPIPMPALQIAGAEGSPVALSWPALPGLIYQVQYRTNLIQENWQNLGGPITATNGTMSASDSTEPDAQRFYRVTVSPQP